MGDDENVEEKKCDTVDVVKYLEGYGVTSDMMDESSLRYLIKENEDKQQQEETEVDVNNDIEKTNTNDDIDTHELLFQETKESSVLFYEVKTKLLE